MKSEKIRTFIIIGAVIFSVVYIFVGVKPLTKELNLKPEWTSSIKNVTRLSSEELEQTELIPYKSKNCIGYFTPEGKIVSNIPYWYKSTISRDYYSIFNEYTRVQEIYTNKSSKLISIASEGFPFIQENRIFVQSPNGCGLKKYSSDGTKIFEYDYYCPITAISSNENATLIGFSDGSVVIVYDDGTYTKPFYPGASEKQVILGCDISKDGKRIALLCGHNKMRIVIADVEDLYIKVIYHRFIDEEQYTQSLVKFSSDDNTVYFNYNGGLGTVNLKKKKAYKMDIPGKIVQCEFLDSQKMAFILSRNEDTYTITVVESINHKIAQYSFAAKNSFITVDKDKLYVEKDNDISCLTVSRR